MIFVIHIGIFILIIFHISDTKKYRVSQKKGCIVIYLPPKDDEGNDKSDHTLSDIHTRSKCVSTMNSTCSDQLVAGRTKSGPWRTSEAPPKGHFGAKMGPFRGPRTALEVY